MDKKALIKEWFEDHKLFRDPLFKDYSDCDSIWLLSTAIECGRKIRAINRFSPTKTNILRGQQTVNQSWRQKDRLW
jgi:hypothetical protein